MDVHLNLTSAGYSLAIVIFQIGYVFFQVPSQYLPPSPSHPYPPSDTNPPQHDPLPHPSLPLHPHPDGHLGQRISANGTCKNTRSANRHALPPRRDTGRVQPRCYLHDLDVVLSARAVEAVHVLSVGGDSVGGFGAYAGLLAVGAGSYIAAVFLFRRSPFTLKTRRR